MALINVREVYPGVHLGLWQIGESVSDFLESYPWMKVYIKDLELYKSEGRKLEFLAVRALLREMLLIAGYSEEQIGKIGEITKWLNQKIHWYGSTRTPKEVIANVCGKEVSAEPLIRYFKEKYSKLYDLNV